MSYAFRHCEIRSNTHVQDNIHLMEIGWPGAGSIEPGQFFMLKAPDSAPLLPRPLSVCELSADSVSFCYAAVGEGTGKLSRLPAGGELAATGPLGNGFVDLPAAERIAVVSGGVGIAPFAELVKRLPPERVTLYAGFASRPYLLEKFASISDIRVATDDGSLGHRGFITELFDPAPYDLVLTCGPEAMMRVVIGRCNARGVPLFASFDRRMACGIGACLVCACRTKYGNKRCCADGPVFRGGDFEERAYDV